MARQITVEDTYTCADRVGCTEPTVGKSKYCAEHRAASRKRFGAFLAQQAQVKVTVKAGRKGAR